MTTKPDDIIGVLDNLIASACTAGCNLWVC